MEAFIEETRQARIAELMAKLEGLVGLGEVKRKMKSMLNLVGLQKKTAEVRNEPFTGQSLHMQFLGNPGTGKTVVARIVGETLLAMGAIRPKDQTLQDQYKYWKAVAAKMSGKRGKASDSETFLFQEASRADLVGEYRGHTAPKVQALVQKCLGGVLFIDEAYSLVHGSSDTFGREAVDTLMKEMEDQRQHIIIIVAGYHDEMVDFFNSNPGLESRVPFDFQFPDYTCPELIQIAKLQIGEKAMSFASSGGAQLVQPGAVGTDAPDECDTPSSSCWWFANTVRLATMCCDKPEDCAGRDEDRTNGNGRTVRNILEGTYRQTATRVLSLYNAKYLFAAVEALGGDPKPDPEPLACDASSAYGALVQGLQGRSPQALTEDQVSGVEVRCAFALVEARDVLLAAVDMVNMNVAACGMSIEEHHLLSLVSQSSQWISLASIAAQVSQAEGDEAGSELEDACLELRTLVDNTGLNGGALLEHNSTAHPNAPPGFESMREPGHCKGFSSGNLPSEARQLDWAGCVAWCTRLGGACTGFAYQQRPSTCTVYKEVIPRRGNFRTGVWCYRNVAAAAPGSAAAPSARKPKAGQKPPVPQSGHVNPPRHPAQPAKPAVPARVGLQAPGVGEYSGRVAKAKEKRTNIQTGRNERVDMLTQKLNSLIGLDKVKAGMNELRILVEFDVWRGHLLPHAPTLLGQSFHMQFLGNPGTGKTVVARIVGELLTELGVISPKVLKKDKEPVFVEASRAELVAQAVGQTAPKVKSVVASALGGVLFIDEAYSLRKEGKDTFGQEAVDFLIKEMEDNRKHVIVIFAGYKAEMNRFFKSNPGFKSRVPFRFHFDDYKCDELHSIGVQFFNNSDLNPTSGATQWFNRAIDLTTGCCDTDGCASSRDSGNGRTVRNIFEATTQSFAARVVPQAFDDKPLQDFLKRLDDFRSKLEAGQDPAMEYGSAEAIEHICAGSDICSHARTVLTAVEASDMFPVASSTVSTQLRKSCKGENVDIADVDALTRNALPHIDNDTWEELALLVQEGDCSGFVEATSKGGHGKAGSADDASFLKFMSESEVMQPVYQEVKDLIGLTEIKASMGRLFGLVKFNEWRKGLGQASLSGQSFHMRFLGNPGTGKTEVARIVGKMLASVGVVSKPKLEAALGKEAAKKGKKGNSSGSEEPAPVVFNEVSRADMVAGYVGCTAPKVYEQVKKAFGGVLFIDEAYSLVRTTDDTFGVEAVDTLIKAMEDERKHVVVILAGYEDEMDQFFQSNPGFKSRVPFTFHFKDYSCKELGDIGALHFKKRGFEWNNEDLQQPLQSVIEFSTGCCADVSSADCHLPRNAGNGREVRNIVEALERQLADRVMADGANDLAAMSARTLAAQLTTFHVQDFQAVLVDKAVSKLSRPCGRGGFFEQLGNAALELGGLELWVDSFKLSHPTDLLHSLVREAGRLGSAVSAFKDERLLELHSTCTQSLDTLERKLHDHALAVCGGGSCDESGGKLGQLCTSMPDVGGQLETLALKQLLRDINLATTDASILMHLLEGEHVPDRILRLQKQAGTCRKSMRAMEAKTLVVPVRNVLGSRFRHFWRDEAGSA